MLIELSQGLSNPSMTYALLRFCRVGVYVFLSQDKIILVALYCFYNAFLNQQFQMELHFTCALWLQEDHSSLLLGVEHDENTKLPKCFLSLGVEMSKIHFQLCTWSRHLTLAEIHWETVESHVSRSEIVKIFVHKTVCNQRMEKPSRKRNISPMCYFSSGW